jgi:hypothetical protein
VRNGRAHRRRTSATSISNQFPMGRGAAQEVAPVYSMDLKAEFHNVTRRQFERSNRVAPAEMAMMRADTEYELEDAWSEHADHFPDESVEREYLLTVYHSHLARIRTNAAIARALRV